MDLIFLHGPPAAGKLTTARALERLVGFPVFHNHLAVDLLTGFFPFGTRSGAGPPAAVSRRGHVSTATPPAGMPRRSWLLTWVYRHIGRSSSRTVCLGMSASVQIPRSIPGRN